MELHCNKCGKKYQWLCQNTLETPALARFLIHSHESNIAIYPIYHLLVSSKICSEKAEVICIEKGAVVGVSNLEAE